MFVLLMGVIYELCHSITAVLGGSLSPRYGESLGCGWRNSLQLWRVAVNILNSHGQMTRRGPPTWELGVGLTIILNSKENSVTLVRERTIQTEQLPLVGEVTANFCGQRVHRKQQICYKTKQRLRLRCILWINDLSNGMRT
jgi:hypothetical protein